TFVSIMQLKHYHIQILRVAGVSVIKEPIPFNLIKLSMHVQLHNIESNIKDKFKNWSTGKVINHLVEVADMIEITLSLCKDGLINMSEECTLQTSVGDIDWYEVLDNSFTENKRRRLPQ